MLRTHFRRAASVLLGLLALALLAPCAFAAVSHPNPYPNPSLTSAYGSDVPAVVKLSDVSSSGLGWRKLSFDDLESAGTTYELYLWEQVGGTPTLVQTFNNPGDQTRFSYTPTNLKVNTIYNWRVDVDGGTGDIWRFETPMEEPVHQSWRVGTMVRFVWDAGSTYRPPETVMEKMLLIRDYDQFSPYFPGWFVGSPLAFNSGAVVKTWDSQTSGLRNIREFWWPDAGYTRLLPSRGYRWRVVYCNKDGVPLAADRDLDGTNDALAWADGGGDYDSGWTFTTVNEVTYQGGNHNLTKSAIIYWESMYGTKARDPEEQDVTFRKIADNSDSAALGFKQIQEDIHKPSIDTIVLSTEELTASYGGQHNDNWSLASCTVQQPLVPLITQWPGWDTLDRTAKNDSYNFSYTKQDKYEEWVARSLRTWLQDATNRNDWGYNEHAWLENLQHILLIGDADRVAPSFYYYHNIPVGGVPTGSTRHMWDATDFFYATQDDGSEVKVVPHYQIGRIPVRQKSYPTVESDGNAYDPAIPVLKKTENYVTMLGDANGRTSAYNDWFGRAVVVAGSTEYGKWFQFFPAAAQYLLTQRVQTGSSSFRDTFSGLGVHKYDIFGAAGTNEELTRDNVLKHLADPVTPGNDVPGFIYMLTRSMQYDPTQTTTSYDDAGNILYPWPDGYANFNSASIFDSDFELDPDNARRTLLISPAAHAGRYDNAIRNPGSSSIGEAGALAPGGPIGMVGFSSGPYDAPAVTYNRTFDEGPMTESYGSFIDEREGYNYASLNKGVIEMPQNSVTSQTVLGKMELVSDFANAYALTNMPTLGGVYNSALNSYLARHSAALLANDQRVATTLFGASLLGDPAILLPLRNRPNQDSTRPVITDVNPRVEDQTDPFLDSYNTSDIPVHIIPHMAEYNPAGGVDVSLRIQTNAPHVRVRVMTPFRENPGYVPGYWNDTSDTNWSTPDAEVLATSINQASYTFNAKAPSIYLVVVQGENPKWETGDDEDWRWLQERWIYVQAVNAFQRSSDLATNILVIDGDQYDRYHLHGYYNTVPSAAIDIVANNVEQWYVHPSIDDAGYNEGDDPVDYNHSPALSVLNKLLGPDIGTTSKYKYQFWCTNVYRTNMENAEAMRQGQRFMGDITNGGLSSFLTSKGVVIYFTGDASRAGEVGNLWWWPRGYLFPRLMMEVNDIKFLTSYVNGGGRLLLSNQNMVSEADVSPFTVPFERTILGAVSLTHDTDYTNMKGLEPGTMSALITDLNITGGEGNDAGQDNAVWTGETDLNGTEAKALFTWDPSFGPGYPPVPKYSAISNRVLAGGGRTIFFTWPFESIWTLGALDLDSTGRANVMRQAIDWLRSVPKASNPDPIDLAEGVPLDKTLSWSIVPEAAYYRLYLVADDQANLEQPANLHDNIPRDNPRFTPAAPLEKNTRYFWRVDTKNVDDYTTGDVWSFKTVDDAPQASRPVPADGAVDIPLDQVLSWYLDPLVDTYDLYIWKDGEALTPILGLTEATYTPTTLLEPNRTYTWRVDTRNTLGVTTGVVWTFDTITPPPPPGNPPNPTDEAAGVATNQILSWPPTPRTDSYDIFVWIDGDPEPDPPPDGEPFSTTTPATTFTIWSGSSSTNSFVPGELPTTQTMRWQVRPVNAAGRQNGLDKTGADTGLLQTWTFYTDSTVADPIAPANPIYPANGAFGVGVSPTLIWERGQGASLYSVYFWTAGDERPTDPLGSTAESQWPIIAPVGPLENGQEYNWQIVAENSDGVQATGGIWTFTVGAAKVTGMAPANFATGVELDVTLNWNDSQGAASYDVYMATGIREVLTLKDNVTESEYTPPNPLLPLTLYRWRVDSVAEDGVTVTTGDEISFTTATANEGPPSAVSNMRPLDEAVNIGPIVTFTWTGGAGATTYEFYLGANALPGVATATLPATQTSYQPVAPLSPLQPSTLYYWKVRSINDKGYTDSPTFTFRTFGLPSAVTEMKPPDGAVNVVTNVILKWKKGTGVSSYQIFIGANVLPATATYTGISPLLGQYQPAALAANTLYYWKVRSVNDMGFADSPTFTFTTGDGVGPDPTAAGGGGGGGCFIATSAFESVAPGLGDRTEVNCTGLYSVTPERLGQLNEIRGLRDSLLLPLSAGRNFSAWYYAVGPHAADAIRHNEPAKAAVRKVLLDPLSQLSREVCE